MNISFNSHYAFLNNLFNSKKNSIERPLEHASSEYIRVGGFYWGLGSCCLLSSFKGTIENLETGSTFEKININSKTESHNNNSQNEEINHGNNSKEIENSQNKEHDNPLYNLDLLSTLLSELIDSINSSNSHLGWSFSPVLNIDPNITATHYAILTIYLLYDKFKVILFKNGIHLKEKLIDSKNESISEIFKKLQLLTSIICELDIDLIWNNLFNNCEYFLDFDLRQVYNFLSVICLVDSFRNSFHGDISLAKIYNVIFSERGNCTKNSTHQIITKYIGIHNSNILLNFIKKCFNMDGGFGPLPSRESHGAYAFCAVNSLVLLGGLDDFVMNYDTDMNNEYFLSRLLNWLGDRQVAISGGFNGRPEKWPDVCYSWWILSTLGFLTEKYNEFLTYDEKKKNIHDLDTNYLPVEHSRKGVDDFRKKETKMENRGIRNINSIHSYVNLNKLANFIRNCQDSENGGYADRPGDASDVFHTFFALASLSLIDNDGYIDCIWSVPRDSVIQLPLY